MPTISIPGKTFLIGEYAVLQGGSALILCTQPCFVLKTTPAEKLQHPFHPQSPAGKWITLHTDDFKHQTLEWTSPYPQGGFGASTAEFLACYKLQQQLTQAEASTDWRELLKTYQELAYDKHGIPPSGADLVAQNYEKIVYFQPDNDPVTMDWPFADLSLCIFKTPIKVPTHDHLKNLQKLPNTAQLAQITLQAHGALKQNHPEHFIQAINQYADELENQHLTIDSTKHLLQNMKQHPACLAAKGCGALGADVITTIIHQKQEEDFKQITEKLGLISIASHQNLFKKVY